MGVSMVTLEEIKPIRIEMFYHRINMISQNNFILICSDVKAEVFRLWHEGITMSNKKKCFKKVATVYPDDGFDTTGIILSNFIR